MSQNPRPMIYTRGSHPGRWHRGYRTHTSKHRVIGSLRLEPCLLYTSDPTETNFSSAPTTATSTTSRRQTGHSYGSCLSVSRSSASPRSTRSSSTTLRPGSSVPPAHLPRQSSCGSFRRPPASPRRRPSRTQPSMWARVIGTCTPSRPTETGPASDNAGLGASRGEFAWLPNDTVPAPVTNTDCTGAMNTSQRTVPASR